jgi:hypothetical protein
MPTNLDDTVVMFRSTTFATEEGTGYKVALPSFDVDPDRTCAKQTMTVNEPK